MKTVIFNTEAKAEAQQAKDFILWIEDHPGEAYRTQTTRYAKPRKRLDGDWDYTEHPRQDYKSIKKATFKKSNYKKPEGP